MLSTIASQIERSKMIRFLSYCTHSIERASLIFKIMKTKLIFVLLFLFICGCSKEIVRRKQPVMGTFVEIKVITTDVPHAEKSIEKVFFEIDRIENIFSDYKNESLVGKLNHNKEIITDNTEFIELLNRSIYFSEITDGLFDITVKPLMLLWNFKENKKPPDKEKIKKILKSVGYKNIIIKNYNNKTKKIILENSAMLDFGGIAKGYAVDKAIEILYKENITTALVNIGGNIRTIGKRKWKIGIRNPDNGNNIIKILSLKNQSVSTSGNYEQYFIYKGKRYTHILNPKNGYPVDTDYKSVTIVSDNATDSDALSTIVFLLGQKKGYEFLKKYFPKAELLIF